MGEVCVQVENTYIPSMQRRKKQSKLDTAGNVHAQTMKGVFMVGSAARIVTETKSSLPALQELPSHQEPVGNQGKPMKKPGRWSRFGKFRVDTKKTKGLTTWVILPRSACWTLPPFAKVLGRP